MPKKKTNKITPKKTRRFDGKNFRYQIKSVEKAYVLAKQKSFKKKNPNGKTRITTIGNTYVLYGRKTK